jgi:hypothetical protein
MLRWVRERWPSLSRKDIGILIIVAIFVGVVIFVDMVFIARKVSGQLPSNLNLGPEWECSIRMGGGVPRHCLRIPPEERANSLAPASPP